MVQDLRGSPRRTTWPPQEPSSSTWFCAGRCSRRSPRSSPPRPVLLAFEELEARSPRPTPRRARRPSHAQRPAAQRNLGHLPDLPRTYEVIEPESTRCPCCGEMVKIGETAPSGWTCSGAASGHRHHPAEVRLSPCEEGVTQALAPAHLIEGGCPPRGLFARAGVEVRDHLPLYRQAQITPAAGDLHRSTLADWVGKARSSSAGSSA